jgi:hypothetical protein
MSSIAEQILEAIFTKFQNNIPGATSFRSRQAALALTEGIAVILEPDEEVTTKISPALIKRDFDIKVSILARSPTIPDEALDPIRVEMHSTLMLDQTLGGIALSITEQGTKWTFEEADQTAVQAESHYKIFYATPPNTLTKIA